MAAERSDGWEQWGWRTGDRGPLHDRQHGGGLLVSEPEDGHARPTNVTETLVATSAIMPGAFVAPATTRLGWNADRAVTELYSLHYRTLVRLAALLVRDTPTAEEVVQDAFVAMHDAWQRLRDAENALAYLRQAVVNRSRSVLRHRTVVDRNLVKAPPDTPSTGRWSCSSGPRSSPRCADCRNGNARRSCCGTMPTCPRPRSPPRWASAAAP